MKMGLLPPEPAHTESSATAPASTLVSGVHVHGRGTQSDDTLTTIGSITLDNSTAHVATSKKYITVLLPDETADGGKAASPGDHYLAGVTVKAATLANKEKLGCLLSTERKVPPSCLRGSQSLALKRHWHWPCFALAVAALGATVTLLLVYCLALLRPQDPLPLPSDGGPEALPDGILLAGRGQWGAQPPRRSMPLLATPVQYVVVHHTATDQCAYPSYCADLVRAFQRYHQDPKPQGRDWDDIGYNFLVGGDGIVYVGRGWDSGGGHFDNTVWNQTMNIALIGNYVQTLPPWHQREQLQKFIGWGVTLGKIRRDYQLLGACQIKSTLSPGRRLMDELRTWPHWWNYTDAEIRCP